MKKSGGFTRGRGITDQQRLTWLLSMLLCGEAKRAVKDMSVAKYTTGEQNKDIAKARQHRDMKYTDTLLLCSVCLSLRNIMTGVNANGDVDREDDGGLNVG